jgi:hypothetical protein
MAQDWVKIKTSIWMDSDFTNLPSEAQRVYHLIIEQPEVTLCGVIQPACKRWARYATDSTIEGIELAVSILRARSFIEIDEDTDELLIRSFVRHGVALSSDNAIVGMSRAFETIHSEVLRKVVIEELRKVDDQDLKNRLTRNVPDGEKKPLRTRLSNSFVMAWDGTS